jgi:hypothetical protein
MKHTKQEKKMDSPYKAPASDLGGSKQDWKRPRFLTVWLWIMLISNGATVPLTLLGVDAIQKQNPKMVGFLVYSLALGAAINFVMTIGIMKYKKWGFWGFCGCTGYGFCVNLYAIGLYGALSGLLGFLILLGLLMMGGKDRTWDRLR